MSRFQHPATQNRLLGLLDADDYERLEPHLERVDLPVRYVLARAYEPISHAYFPTSGIGSIVVTSPEGQQTEGGLFGREGWGPTTLILESTESPHEIFMQTGGEGYRVAVAELRQALDERPAIRVLLTRFVQALWAQTAFTALSNAVHHIDERLARWLLMCHDRTDGDELTLTHEFISLMLAVRRPSVTTALHVLEGNRFIRAERGTITIRDREGLEAFASDVYGGGEAEYRRLIGPM